MNRWVQPCAHQQQITLITIGIEHQIYRIEYRHKCHLYQETIYIIHIYIYIYNNRGIILRRFCNKDGFVINEKIYTQCV